MILRQKLLLLFAATITAAVAVVAWTVLLRIKNVFELRDQEETALFVAQFQREFQSRSTEVASAIDRLAASERARSIAVEIAQTGDSALYVTEAQHLASEAHLDFLEIVSPTGEIISSAQWPARFGYTDAAAATQNSSAFLKRESLPDGTSQLGLFAVRPVLGSGPTIRIIGGQKLDQAFLADLPVAPGMTIALYADDAAQAPDAASAVNPKHLITSDGAPASVQPYQSIIIAALKTGQQVSSIVYLTRHREDSANVTAIPLKNDQGQTLAVVTVAISRKGMVEAQQHIRAISYGVASGGILLAIVFSLWIAARVSRPIEELARASEGVAAGNWDVSVPERGRDELSVLARSFNHMTAQLTAQRDKLVQTERVAAWRELARRLAHELKNPLFPLQLTVENLARSRHLPPEEFDEVFEESTRTLSMEIANLKAIIGRFGDFSKMPKPEVERIETADVIWRVALLYFPSLVRGMTVEDADAAAEMDKIRCSVELALDPMPLDADPELLHRALSNLVLNARDAMPEGGTLRLGARPLPDSIEITVADSGRGLTPEECDRLFTPYYTTKEHGTGLGLAIVQSIVADHNGTIRVESPSGGGATFIITLPRAVESLTTDN
ncbi:sensor histidine kinase [Occallatibacter riparius]|uniref:Signal transduction histidine-protein kinase/phosphatase MprB n=1 Tax=Occallatibacter riparius TaxID=1002689 RepID=A0A9J7BSM6_9BACT|nr:ATP-binding protein [Occallatibacter riparius]UWZ85585.1 ATP-binding protein [Occallatibacter riparius]